MASYLDDLLKKINNSGSDVDTTNWPTPVPPAKTVMSPGTGGANQNFLDAMLGSTDTNPANLYGAASAASAPFQAPTDTGGGQVPSRMPELRADPSMPRVGMGDSLTQRSGDDMPKPTDEIEDESSQLVEPNLDTFRKENTVTEAAKVAPQEPEVDKAMLDAQDRSNNLAALLLLGKGAEKIGSGIARTKSDGNYLNELAPMVNRPVEDLNVQRKAASDKTDLDIKKFNYSFAKDKDDPNSPSSKFYRDTLSELTKQSGISLKMPDGLSAAEMEKIYPNIINIVNAKEAREAKMIAAKTSGSAKADKVNEVRVESLKKDLDPNQARGGNLAKSQAMINSADRVDALFQQFPDYNIPANQSVELSSALAGLINGGSAQSQHQIDSLTPSSLKGDANKIASWVTGNPRGLEQQKFMKMMHETTVRERDVAQTQVRQAQIQRLSAHGKLRDSDPEIYNAVLSAYGIEPEMIDNKGRYHAPKAGGETKAAGPAAKGGMTPAQEAGVANFMKANKITNKDEAIKILKDAGKL